MAHRPVFVPLPHKPWVRPQSIEFTWHAGLAVTQKQKSIVSLHSAARSRLQLSRILEVSSKSIAPEGVAASAFNLSIELPDGSRTTLEWAYQGSKKFTGGGPYTDIYRSTSLEAKRDERVRSGAGRLLGFEYFGQKWPLEPQSLFYDWLYVSAMAQPSNAQLLSLVLENDAFTDIEFNPERSVSCQASSAALIVGLRRADHDLAIVTEPTRFRSLFFGGGRELRTGQAPLF